jgi:membrane protein
VPATPVRWTHALLGGVFVATGLRLCQQALLWYLGSVPTYSVVYGAFATLPILLLWIYVLWVVMLLGAVMVAYLPSLLAGVARRGDSPGWDCQLALESLQVLWALQDTPVKGVSLAALAERLRVDPLQLEGPIATLVAMDWVGRLDDAEGRHVLLVRPDSTPVAPLLEHLLLPNTPGSRALWESSGWAQTTLSDALSAPDATVWWGQAAKKPVSADNMPSGSSVI